MVVRSFLCDSSVAGHSAVVLEPPNSGEKTCKGVACMECVVQEEALALGIWLRCWFTKLYVVRVRFVTGAGLGRVRGNGKMGSN